MSKSIHRFALLVAGATFFLIIAGANVTSHDAGLATSDWPRSNGTFFPKMVGNLFWEHGHRLVAGAGKAAWLGCTRRSGRASTARRRYRQDESAAGCFCSARYAGAVVLSHYG